MLSKDQADNKLKANCAKVLLDWYRLGIEHEEMTKRATHAEAEVVELQRYLEKLGKSPAPFLFSWSGLQDYFSAKELAKKWGHNPSFLRRYGKMVAVGLALFFAGAVLAGLSQL